MVLGERYTHHGTGYTTPTMVPGIPHPPWYTLYYTTLGTPCIYTTVDGSSTAVRTGVRTDGRGPGL